jgi:hypothetical protein
MARVFSARTGTAIAVFLAIAMALLAFVSSGLLASAEATDGTTATQPPPVVEEPVLGGDPATGQPAGEQPPPVETEVPPVEPPVDDPAAPVEPPVDDPGTVPPAGEEPGLDEPGTEEPSVGEDPGTEEPPAEDPNSGGDTGNRTGDPDIPPPTEAEDPTPPSGGSKGSDPEDGSDALEPDPDPNSLPQVTLPAPEVGEEPLDVPPPTPQPDDPDAVVGNGEGTMADGEQLPGGGGGDDNTARFGTAAGGQGGAVADGGTGAGGTIVAGTELAAVQAGGDEPAGDGGGGPGGENESSGGGGGSGEGDSNNVVTNTVERLVEVVPDELKAALAALAALSVMLGIGYLLAALRARRLARQRRELLQEVGLLQTALLPPVPDKVGALLTSVAYRPADGPGAGGDFYDVLPLTGGRVGFILGDVSGHGRGALARTAFMRYTLRAYLEAGLEPRVALQVAGRVIDDNLGGDFATVLLAVHDPDTGSLTYASAGHPAPLVAGPHPHEPITAASSPPIGVGVRTGLRQTTVPLVPGATAALFTDGLLEARTEDGILGRERLAELLAGLGEGATARQLIERVAAEANVRSDDMAAVVVSPTAGVTTGLFRTEQLELSTRELEGPIARRFLEACGLSEQEIEDAERDAQLLAERFGGVVLHVVFGNRLRVEVLPRNVESIEAASRRVSAGNPQ